MNGRIALATLALMVTTLSFASAGDRYEGLAGSYKEKSGGEMKIRKADDNKKEAGPWRFVLEGDGDWPCAEGQDNPGGGKPTTFFIEFSAGKFKGERYNIVRDKDGELKELQLVGGSKAIWVKQSKKDLEGLQGTWEVVELTSDGEPSPEEVRKEIKVIFKGEKMQLSGPKNTIGKREYSLNLDPVKKPKAIDFTPLDGPFKGKTVPAIYELKGDELKFCMPNRVTKDRPTEFKAAEGSMLTLFVLKRSK